MYTDLQSLDQTRRHRSPSYGLLGQGKPCEFYGPVDYTRNIQVRTGYPTPLFVYGLPVRASPLHAKVFPNQGPKARHHTPVRILMPVSGRLSALEGFTLGIHGACNFSGSI